MCRLYVAQGGWTLGSIGGRGRSRRRRWHIGIWRRRLGRSGHEGHSMGKEAWGVGTCAAITLGNWAWKCCKSEPSNPTGCGDHRTRSRYCFLRACIKWSVFFLPTYLTLK